MSEEDEFPIVGILGKVGAMFAVLPANSWSTENDLEGNRDRLIQNLEMLQANMPVNIRQFVKTDEELKKWCDVISREPDSAKYYDVDFLLDRGIYTNPKTKVAEYRYLTVWKPVLLTEAKVKTDYPVEYQKFQSELKNERKNARAARCEKRREQRKKGSCFLKFSNY